jgi:hypothetical protein
MRTRVERFPEAASNFILRRISKRVLRSKGSAWFNCIHRPTYPRLDRQNVGSIPLRVPFQPAEILCQPFDPIISVADKEQGIVNGNGDRVWGLHAKVHLPS